MLRCCGEVGAVEASDESILDRVGLGDRSGGGVSVLLEQVELDLFGARLRRAGGTEVAVLADRLRDVLADADVRQRGVLGCRVAVAGEAEAERLD